MEFDGLLNYYSPEEAQLELMNTMLQLEQLTALDGHRQSAMAPASPPISPMQTHHAGPHSFSPPPHTSTTTTATATATATGYPMKQYAPPRAVYGGLEHHLQLQDGGALALQAGPSSSAAAADAMREAIFRIAALQPVEDQTTTGPEPEPEAEAAVRRAPKRRNVRVSKDPQSVAARLRRERISERIRALQRLVPGGTKMDTASMLDEAIQYVKFLKSQLQSLQRAAASRRAHAPWQYALLPHADML